MTDSERKTVRDAIVKIYRTLEKVELTEYAANLICQLYMALHHPREKGVVLAIVAGHLGHTSQEEQPEIKPEPVIKKRGEFAEMLLADRKKKRVTQAKYGELLKVGGGLYSYWERGEGVPQTQHLYLISEVTKIEVAELLRMMREFVSPIALKKMKEQI